MEVGFTVVDGEDLLRSKEARGAPIGDLHARAAQHRLELGQDHREVVGLTDEGVGAGFERLHLRVPLVGRGQQQARYASQRRVEPDALNDRAAIDAREIAIHDHGGGPHMRRLAQPLLAGARDGHAVAGLQQGGLQGLAEGDAVIDDQHGFLRGRASVLPASDQFVRARHDVAGVIGLADIFVGAGLQATDSVAHFGLGRQQHHRRAGGGRVRADFLEQFDAVGVRQQDVQDGQGEPRFGQRLARLRPRGARHHGKVRRLKHLHKAHPDGQAVVHDEHGPVHRRASLLSAASSGPISPSGRIRSAAPSRIASRGMP